MATAEDFHVIVGDFNDAFVEIVAESVADALDPCQRLRVHGTPEADRILAMADERPADLFVLFSQQHELRRLGPQPRGRQFHQGPHAGCAASQDRPPEAHDLATGGLPQPVSLRGHRHPGRCRLFFRMPFDMKAFTGTNPALFTRADPPGNGPAPSTSRPSGRENHTATRPEA